jgi:hypothetical protein
LQAKLTLGDLGITEDKGQGPCYSKNMLKCGSHALYQGAKTAKSTFERYQDLLQRYINPALGKRPIDEIKRGEIRDLLLNSESGRASPEAQFASSEM